MFRVLVRMALAVTMVVSLTSCYMLPLALVGPAASSFSTASIIQSAFTTTANHVVKKTTGKTITQHALENFNENIAIQSYLPTKNVSKSDTKISKFKINKLK